MADEEIIQNLEKKIKNLEEELEELQATISQKIGTNPLSVSGMIGKLTIGPDGNIKGGQTDFDTGDGFFLGKDGTLYKFSVGSSSGGKITFNGVSMTIAAQTNKVAGDILVASADTDRETSLTSYTELKKITVKKGGTYRVKWRLWAVGGTAYGKVYKNSVAHGAEKSTDSGTAQQQSEDLVFSAGDSIQLYAHTDNGLNQAFIDNFRIYSVDWESYSVDTD